MRVYFIVPAYNAEKTIARCVRSVLRQVGLDVFVLIVDHGSGDSTVKIVREEFSCYNNISLLCLDRTEDDISSPSRPLNFALSHVDTLFAIDNKSWFVRLDADDFISDDTSIAKILSKYSKYKLIHNKLIFFDENENYAVSYGPKKNLQNRNDMLRKGAYAAAHHSMLIRGDLLKSLDTFPFVYVEGLFYGEDFELTLQLFEKIGDLDLIFLDFPILYKSLHSDSITESVRCNQIWSSMIQIFKKHNFLSKWLMVSLFFDLLLRGKCSILQILRRVLGYPGRKVGQLDHVPLSLVISREMTLAKGIGECK